MAEEEVKLLGWWGSPYSRRAEVALRLKGIPYEFVDEDLTNKSELLLKSNPVHEKIPVLIHRGQPVADSLVILEYIEDAWSERYRLLPEDALGRAQARFWAKFIDDKCFPAIWMTCWTRGEEQQEFMQKAREALTTLEEGYLEGKKFFGGDSMGFVDLVANSLAFGVGVFEEVNEISIINKESFPTLCRWKEDFMAAEVVKECFPEREKVLKFFLAKKEAMLITKRTAY